MSHSFINAFFSYFVEWLNSLAVGLCETTVEFINKYIIGFFSNSSIELFLSFSTWLNVFLFCVCFLVVAVDLAEEKSSDNPIMWGNVFGNIMKAFLFAMFARWIAVASIELVEKITAAFEFSISSQQTQATIGDILVKMAVPAKIQLIVSSIFYLALLCACIYFFISALKRFGVMFIHIFQSFLYIPDIMRGNTVKMGEWLRQMVSIALTYGFTYILFFLGCYFFNGSDFLISIAMWISMPMVPKVLNHFGWSSGTTGNFGSTALYTGSTLIQAFR